MSSLIQSFNKRRQRQVQEQQHDRDWAENNTPPVTVAPHVSRQFDLFPLDIAIDVGRKRSRADLQAIAGALVTLFRYHDRIAG